jgi:uncharacterized 2Fe-2S/4Fe-4S cluster protein (DUF4445 family)
MSASRKAKEKKQQSQNFEWTVLFSPFGIRARIKPGATLLEATKKANLPLKTTCGGKGTCGDCIVQIKKGVFKTRPSAALPDHLVKQRYALACQTEILDNMEVQLPEFQELSIESVSDARFIQDNINNLSGTYEIDPLIRMTEIRIPSPTLEDNYSDWSRIKREIQKRMGINDLDCGYSVLRKLAHTVRENQGYIGIVLLGSGKQWAMIDVFPAQKKKRIYGIACDVGTSTVVLHLVNLENGEILATASSYNHQIKCGEDIISRINYSQKPTGLQELHELIIMTVNSLIDKTSRSVSVSPSDIYIASLSGNTTMIHLLLNLEPRFIREEPYVPTLNRVPIFSPRDLGLTMNQEARIMCAPLVGSYVGGDITAGLLSTPLLRDPERISLFVDIGTNGELVVGNREWLMTCACSAGPAFEGGGIRYGMPASEGAIEQVRIDPRGNVDYKVIGGTKPKGLCGSGLVDLLAELFIQGYIDRYGKFKEKRKSDRFVDSEDGMGFLVEKAAKSFWGRDILITERDISKLIRTKGAVFSACSLLLKKVGLNCDKIESIYIAGGFGQNLDVENAIRIGLLPDLERNKFHYLGNSSLLGAYLILLSKKNQEIVNNIAEKMTYVELNTDPGYMNEYTGALFLPHTEMDLFPSVKQMFEA